MNTIKDCIKKYKEILVDEGFNLESSEQGDRTEKEYKEYLIQRINENIRELNAILKDVDLIIKEKTNLKKTNPHSNFNKLNKKIANKYLGNIIYSKDSSGKISFYELDHKEKIIGKTDTIKYYKSLEDQTIHKKSFVDDKGEKIEIKVLQGLVPKIWVDLSYDNAEIKGSEIVPSIFNVQFFFDVLELENKTIDKNKIKYSIYFDITMEGSSEFKDKFQVLSAEEKEEVLKRYNCYLDNIDNIRIPEDKFKKIQFFGRNSKDEKRDDINITDYNINSSEIGSYLKNKFAIGDFDRIQPRIEQEIDLNEIENIDIDKIIIEEIFLMQKFYKWSIDYEPDYSPIGKILKESHNLILSGPPGTGKTRIAKIEATRVASGEGANLNETSAIDNFSLYYQDKIELIQFHPGYSYNDFLETIKIDNAQNGARISPQIFKQFASRAEKDPGNDYVLIIDEINRANVSDVLGELLYALEYRGDQVTTEISQETFSVPNNLYIIGTMNTADRSLMKLDYAVRRRFSFIKVPAEQPEPINKEKRNKRGKGKIDCNLLNPDNYEDYYITERKSDNGVEKTITFCNKIYKKVRNDIKESVSLDVQVEDILPGISYFLVNGEPIKADGSSSDSGKGLNDDGEQHLRYKIKYELIPLLKEYAKDGMFSKRNKLSSDANYRSLIEMLVDDKDSYESILFSYI